MDRAGITAWSFLYPAVTVVIFSVCQSSGYLLIIGFIVP